MPDDSAATIPRRSRRWWIAPYRKTDDSQWPCVHFVGLRGRFRFHFFDLSFAWGIKKVKSW